MSRQYPDMPEWPIDYVVRPHPPEGRPPRYVTVPLPMIAESGTEILTINTGSIPVGSAVYADGSNLQLASSDPAEAHFVGFVIESGKLQISGAVTLSGLTPGATYYLTSTPGEISTNYPTAIGEAIVRVGYAISETLLVIDHQEIVIL